MKKIGVQHMLEVFYTEKSDDEGFTTYVSRGNRKGKRFKLW